MRFTAAIALATLMLLARPAAAAEESHPRVRLDAQPCVGVAISEVRRIFAIELGALVVADGEAPAGDITLVNISCDKQLVRLSVEDPITGKSLQRSVELNEAAQPMRARLVALAASELVYASWTELAVNPSPEVQPAGIRASVDVVRAARDTVQKKLPKRLNPPQPLRAVGVVSRRWFVSEGGELWGGGLRISDDPFSLFGWSADALVEYGSVQRALGRVDIDTATLGGSIVLHTEWGPLSLRSGLGLRMGAARMSGVPISSDLAIGRSVWAPWGWPLGVLALSVTPIRPLVIELQGEMGYVVLPLGGKAGGGQEISLAGSWAAVQLGLGMYL